MASVTPKMEILVDLSKPVEEIQTCIAIIVNAHPGKQLDILHQVDLWLGEQIIKVEEGTKQTPTETAHTEEVKPT